MRVPWTLARRSSALAFVCLLVLGRSGLVGIFQGTTANSLLFGRLPLADPATALEVSLASDSWPKTLWLGAGLVALATLALGPVFCGWVCPLSQLLEGVRSLRRRTPTSRQASSNPVTRRAILLCFLAIALVGGLPLHAALSPVHCLSRSIAAGLDITITITITGCVLVAEFIRPHLWCKHLCPMGAVYGPLGRRAPLRVHLDPQTAGRTLCGLCTTHCPAGIPVMGRFAQERRPWIDDELCTRCGACVDACPKGVLRLSFNSTPWRQRSGPSRAKELVEGCSGH